MKKIMNTTTTLKPLTPEVLRQAAEGGMDLREYDLAGANLTDADLSGVDLSGTLK